MKRILTTLCFLGFTGIVWASEDLPEQPRTSNTIYSPPPRNMGPIPTPEYGLWSGFTSLIDAVADLFVEEDTSIPAATLPEEAVVLEQPIVPADPTAFQRKLSAHWSESDLEADEVTFMKVLAENAHGKTPNSLLQKIECREDADTFFKYLSLQEGKQNLDFKDTRPESLNWLVSYMTTHPQSLKNLVKITHPHFYLNIEQLHQFFDTLHQRSSADKSMIILDIQPDSRLDTAIFVAMASRYSQVNEKILIIINAANLPSGYQEFVSNRLQFIDCNANNRSRLSSHILKMMRNIAENKDYNLTTPDQKNVHLQKL
ncbi:MAG: hypothetical protein KBB83_05540 [Alphaproteobacteria bacterium]|nr:hypothetical protein [Alphaproteobacteria bacterium]